ncbi:MAG: hypothetical protein V4659_04105 [Pseudomonadota bacterium]
MLDLAAFRDTATRYTAADGLAFLGIDADYLTGTDTTHLWIYNGSCYVEEGTNGFHVLIDRSEWDGTKADLEARLYFGWYVSEGGDTPTLDQLSGLLAEWSAWRGLKLQSADEMILHAAGTDEHFLSWFIDAWEDAERRDDGQGFGNRA